MFILDFFLGGLMDQLIDWIYSQLVGFFGNFFAAMGNMGVELFDMEWVQSIVLFFSYLGWALYGVGLVVAVFEVGIECQTGRANVKDAALNAIKGFMAVSLFTVVPVRLYELCVSLQGTFTAALTGYGTSIGDVAGEVMKEFNAVESISNLTAGPLLGYDRDRYLFVFEEKDYGGYTESKFDVLEKVRQVQAGEGVSATLSIGVGRDEDSFDQLFKNASLALEMALSRGGDQAVVKDRVNFEFYGGRSKTTEKRTKVKSRVMANALGELIDDAKQVYVMGHKYADMDSVGAAMGVYCIARKRGKKCQIVIDTENNAAHPLIRKMLEQPEYAGGLISGGEAFLKCQPGALLVVVDTNRPESVESEEMLETCNRVAVIDHHRRGSSYIEKMALNYHEPYASSASELVAELMQYLLEPSDVLKCEAEALLAGIVLDTKNFTNRTGGRTFEAAAYLRRLGADTQDVQRLFQGDLQSMIDRYAIIRQAELYHDDIAVVALEDECDRVTAAKAADELLTIRGIKASIVLYRKGDGVYMSARSLGEVNVQVILEALGGGGNSTTAGGQADNISVDEAKAKLLAAIDHYFEN